MSAKLGSTPGKGALPTAFIIITVITLSLLILFSFNNIPSILPLTSTKCILYDRPPRTGSTTISKALTSCMRQKKYSHTKIRGNHSMAVDIMLSSPSNFLAAVSSHVAISANDLARLKWECGELLYISSCAPMKERIFSAAKYSMIQGHGNGTVADDKAKKLRDWMDRHDDHEELLENYPFVNDLKRPMAVDLSKRIVPDYVIRKKSMHEDLTKLLMALGCDTSFKLDNVHIAKFDEEKILSEIELRMGDKVNQWLLDVAKGNERGLEKARLF